MLRELVAETGAGAWAAGSLLFFLAVWVGIAVWTLRARAEEMEARARLALEGEGTGRSEAPPRGATEA
ncbi:MAG: hypothetical protein KJ058_05695 [Thermoanaerobaculia bacterium]|nr:hypothetical protein [Thermoanaerobaculia bacterium]